jgi:hypothetical protein
MLQPEISPKNYESIFTNIDNGIIKIPQFQRDFVWNKVQTAKLIDSILKGFPIGTFIFWKTKDGLRSIKNIGNAPLPDIPKGDAAYYVLDGQQRITSIYAVKKGLIINRDGKELDYKDIFINLNLKQNSDEEIVTIEPEDDKSFISVFELLNGTMSSLSKNFIKYIDLLDEYKKRLTSYHFPVIVIENYPIDIACEVFTRINTGGQELTLFEIMVAKTYDEDKNFDLLQKYEWLIDNKGVEKDLEDAGFDTIPAVTILQCISAYLCKQIKRQDILKLDKDDFIESWEIIKNGIFHSVDFIRTHLRIPVSRMLPYNTIIVPLTYFFIANNFKKPTQLQNKFLTQYFFWSGLSNRYNSGVESKVAADLKRMDDILTENQPSYYGEEVNISLEELEKHQFNTSDGFCKTILCLYSYFEPKSFDSNGVVKIDNSWLRSTSSKNYHHFFPKDYLKKTKFDNGLANSIINITIVDEYLNKRKIGTKAPSIYIKQFKKNNPDIDDTLKTHLISNLDSFGILDDDYEKFLIQRGKKVLNELKKRLEFSLPVQQTKIF